MRLLLEHDANVEVNDMNDKTALQYATEIGHHGEVVKLPREHGANQKHLVTVAFSTCILIPCR